MSDTRQLLRYVIPGLVFFVELAFLAFVTNPSECVNYARADLGGLNVGQPVAFLVFAGGIGFVASVVYQFVAWLPVPYILPAVNYCKLIQRLRVAGLLFLVEQGTNERIEPNDISPSGAWRIVTAIWFCRPPAPHDTEFSNAQAKALLGRAESLADLMHGNGSALSASIGSILIFVYLQLNVLVPHYVGWGPSLPELLLITVLLLSHFFGYVRLRKNAQGIVELMLYDTLQNDYGGRLWKGYGGKFCYAVTDKDIRFLKLALRKATAWWKATKLGARVERWLHRSKME